MAEGNAFAAALVMQAAQHRLEAERWRSMVSSTPDWGIFAYLNKDAEKRAKEHEGLAEVYDRFLSRILSDAIEDYVLREMENLTGPAELIQTEPLRDFRFQPLRDFRFQLQLPPPDIGPGQLLGGI